MVTIVGFCQQLSTQSPNPHLHKCRTEFQLSGLRLGIFYLKW
ncbi:hypothetical protein [cyanobacterium endosymbiont of Rhopalodia gibberula]|nr:hypothetical protein [cyanobacterium endosymbiont of Rhopalodia gibberula]